MSNTLDKNTLKILMKRSTLRVLFHLLLVWGAIIGISELTLTYWSAPVVVTAILLIGALQFHLNIIAHDGLHYALADSRGINDFITRWLLLSPQLVPTGFNRKNHLNHHRYLGQEKDLDGQYYEWKERATKIKFWTWLLSAFSGINVFRIALKFFALEKRIKIEETESTPLFQDGLSIVITQALIAFALFEGDLAAYFLLWVVPIFTSLTGYNSLRSLLEHVDLRNETKGNLLYSFTSNPLELFFIAPFKMNYHAEHHYYMTVPYYNLPKLQKLLLERKDDYPFLLESSYWAKLKKFYADLG